MSLTQTLKGYKPQMLSTVSDFTIAGGKLLPCSSYE